MGLAEKRAIKEATDDWIPKRLAEVEGLVGAPVPYEFDWDSFADDAKGIQWLQHNGPHQVNCAMRVICKDELGKEAIQEAVKKVLFQNAADAADKSLTLEDGVLTMKCAYNQATKGGFGYGEIQRFLEGKL